MSVELPLSFPPSPFVREAAGILQHESLTILDAGACTGRNSVYMAQLGHRVVALTSEKSEALAGAQLVRSMSVEGDCNFVVGDIRRLGLAAVFDVVMANEVFHMMTKQQSYASLAELRGLTKPGGVHVVSGYVVSPREANEQNGRHCFRPQELLNNYQDADWQIVTYQEDPSRVFEHGGRQRVDSLARIVAIK
ncbi:MAG: class I SAM-dependent methyltransferase [Candidatus Saccharimonadales bacterium]